MLVFIITFLGILTFTSSDVKVFEEALKKNDIVTIKKLVFEKNFDENQFINKVEETPFTLTALNDNIKVFSIITIPEKTKFNHQTISGWTALMFAAARGGDPNGNYAEIVKRLLAMGADKSLKNKNGETALDITKRLHNREIIGLLE